jgi:Protein of unknown function DUF262/Protein of unknown function (DUF1524)/Domain of unknown function (DUF4268)
MKPSMKTIGDILHSLSQYVIPVFQRNYRWERPNWEQFWESLIEIQRPDKHGNHFMGFLVFFPELAQPGQNTSFHLIDGQQRLSTSSILLAAIRNVARQREQNELADEIHEDFLVHHRKKGDQHYRLFPKERDHDSYLAIISGQGKPTGRMGDALAYFDEQLSSYATEQPDGLRRAFDTVCQRFEFMCATLEKGENAYSIFKSLNSTGVPLGSSDLIRNFVFMHVSPDDQDDFDRGLWRPLEDGFGRPDGTLDEERFSRFFRDFLMADGRYVPPAETFANFETRYEATDFSPRSLGQALTSSARDYGVIFGQQPDENGEVTRALAGLNVLDSSTTYPLLLTLFQKRASAAISSPQLARCIEMLRGFILRRFICGESSRGYGRMFVRALTKSDDPVSALESYLLERGWPDDSRFESAFIEFPLYQRGYTRQVLEALERARGHKEPADLGETEVEHVMPQTLNDSWRKDLGPDAEIIHAECLHRPGNLTLSGYNLELWNHPFSEKAKRYSQSNIVITRELAEYDRWAEEEICTRGRKLAQEATRIWIGPKDIVAPTPPDNGGDEDTTGRRELRARFWRGLSDYLVSEHPELPNFEPGQSWTIRLPSGVRHIGLELRFALRQQSIAIEVWFWREASFPVWEEIRHAPGEFNSLVGAKWEFEQVEGQCRGRMSVSQVTEKVRNESSWSDLYRWLGEKLSIVYEGILPKLRRAMDRHESP